MAEVTTSSYEIRYALQSDVPTILQLINELASYEHALHEVLATESSLRSTLSFPTTAKSPDFTPGHAKCILISQSTSTSSRASAPTEVAGMALFFHNYSTWRGAPGIFLEDLFVRPAYRKRGYGKALIQALARECVRLDCKRLEWNVLKWNTPSIDFYQSEVIGAQRMEEWVGMRVDGEGLVKLAQSQ